MALAVQLPHILSGEAASDDGLADHELRDAAPAAAFTDIVALATRMFDVEAAFVSLLDKERQVFQAHMSSSVYEISREAAFCSHALLQKDAFVILDAALDPRFEDNSYVVGAPHIRFYVGVPLRTPSGHAVGALCLADTKPRDVFSDADVHSLRQLANIAIDRMEMGRLEIAQRESQSRFEHITSTSPDGIVCADADGRITVWNAAAERMFGYSGAEAIGQSIDVIAPERMRGGHSNGLQRVATGGDPRLIGKTIELQARHKSGEEFPIELSLSQWQEDGRAAFGSIVRDIRGRRANEERLFRLAHLDPLTELPNRSVLRERLIEITRAARPVSVLMLDLDGFKEVNDNYGHATGDALLRTIAARLLSCVRPIDTVSRLGGDEFVLLLTDSDDPLRATEVANAIIAAVAIPFDHEGQTLKLRGSIGIALSSNSTEGAEYLLSCADLALYQAKSEGRNCYRMFTQVLRDKVRRTRSCREDIGRAVEFNQFRLHYQPQVRLKDGALVGAEALIRWQHPKHGLLTPASFVDVLDSSPHATEVGNWVMRTACAQAAEWRRLGAKDFRMGVNLCSAQFRNGNLAETVREILTSTGLPAANLELEITENIVLRQEAGLAETLHAVRESGVGIAFDDYGTGYASLSLLKRFPLTRLKIDRSFVTGMMGSSKDETIVRAILQLGHGFGLDVIAEGIETAAEHARLRAKGCQEGQGYLFGKPMPADMFAARFDLGAREALANKLAAR
ncbi:EAL domain-containing protein [Methylobacterium sp. W2]|uniref:putative bifunctional diguanylate cyclase/phosphodiesterase n=1 Tax=Methylobacterium sp. W2 TaxID=2598107 RepID=UPI001D0CC26F|nr:EAL domain-containing protein [Methylobacterium sp. W2]MCC0809378.1 EAL domain-containing protein [Methylobacterium sp. W2]